MDIYEESVKFHKRLGGKLGVVPLSDIKNRYDLSIVYTPGVAEVSRRVAADKRLVRKLTISGRAVAVISDGSAVLGLGNIGPEAAMPVMEGKALLLKKFGNVDGIPIVIGTQDPSEIVHFVKNIAPTFAGINLEDISAPRCFQIEEALGDIGIPVFHDDQHGTAIVVAAALKNAARVVAKSYNSLNVVVVGAGAAGLAITKMLLGLNCSSDVCEIVPGHDRVGDVVVVDSRGALSKGRSEQNVYKQAVAGVSNKNGKKGGLEDVIKGADVVVGVSGPNIITSKMVKSMAGKAIVFAMANPIPEIMPGEALGAGAYVVASGRSDFPNQINNVLAFPGIFQAVVRGGLTKITQRMKDAAVDAIYGVVKNPSRDNIIPDVFMPGLAKTVADAILKAG